MSFIRTLDRDIPPAELGFTYSHEHILCVPPYWVERREDDLLLDDPEKSKQDLMIFKQAGGKSIVDATAIDYGRMVREVYDISREAGVQIVGTAGFNKGFLWNAKMPDSDRTFHDWIESSSETELTDFVVNEVEKGMNGTNLRGGQVKFGTGYNSITPLEVKTLRAVSNAHHQTGAPVHSHTESGTMALEQIELLKESGMNLENVSFGHMDRNPDHWMHLKVAETGAFLCFDGVGKVKYGPESLRIACIINLVKHGYQKQILVSGDTARKSYYYSYTYGPGLGFILKKWIPRLLEEAEAAGIDGSTLVQDIFINNPRRCFTFKK